MKFPLIKSSFKLEVQIPKTNIIAIINHALKPFDINHLDYFFDIDTLNHVQFKFDVSLISSQLEQFLGVHLLINLCNKLMVITILNYL